MAVKTYGATRNQAIAQAVASSLTNLETLQNNYYKTIDKIFERYLAEQANVFGNIGAIGLDAFLNFFNGFGAGVADLVSGTELLFAQLANDLGNENISEDLVQRITYAFSNAGSRVFEGGQAFFTGAAYDVGKFVVNSYMDVLKFVDPKGYQNMSRMFNAVQQVSRTENDPLADLLNAYEPGGSFDNLSRFWTGTRADMLRSFESSKLPQISQENLSNLSDEDLKAQEDTSLVEATYGSAFLKKQLDITNATAARRRMMDDMFSNSRASELIAKGGLWGEAAQFVRGVTQSVGRIMPTILISQVAGSLGKSLGLTGKAAAALATTAKVAGNIYFAGSIFGMAMEEALQNGASYDDALTYAFGSSISETAVESLSGYIIGEKLTATTWKEFFADALSEAGEEAVAELGARGLAGYKGYIDKNTGEDIRQEGAGAFLGRVAMSALSGLASGALLGAGNFIQARQVGGSSQAVSETLSQSIKEKGSQQFIQESAPRIQRLLKQLQGKRFTQQQKDAAFDNPYVQKVIQKDANGNYSLTETGQRIVNAYNNKTGDTLLATQGGKVISSSQYAVSDNIFLEKIKEDVTVAVDEKTTKKVKINVATNKDIENIQDTQKRKEIEQIRKTFGNVIFINSTNKDFNSFVDPNTGLIYININSNKGIANLYGHEAHDYLTSLAEKGLMPKEAAKAFLDFEKSVQTLLKRKDLPKSVKKQILFVITNYQEKDWFREIGSFIIQEILVSLDSDKNSSSFIQDLLKIRDKKLSKFFKIFTNEEVLKKLTKEFATTGQMGVLLKLMKKQFSELIAQNDAFLKEQEGIRLTLAFVNSPLFSLSSDELDRIQVEKDLMQKFREGRMSLREQFELFTEKSQKGSRFARQLIYALGFEEHFFNILNTPIKELEAIAPQILNTLSKQNLLKYGFEKETIDSFKSRSDLFKYIARQLKSSGEANPILEQKYGITAIDSEGLIQESEETIANVKDALLYEAGITFFDENSEMRKKGFIFSNRIGAFKEQDFIQMANFIKDLEQKDEELSQRIKLAKLSYSGDLPQIITSIFYFPTANNFEITIEFPMTSNDVDFSYHKKTLFITPSIVNTSGKILRENPKIIYSSLSGVTLDQLVDTGVLPSQSFAIHNFGSINSNTHVFADVHYKYKNKYVGDKADFEGSEKVPIKDAFYATIALKNSVIRDTALIGKRDIYTPTKVLNLDDKTRYRLKFNQGAEQLLLGEGVVPLSRELSINANSLSPNLLNDEIEAFKLSLRYVQQARSSPFVDLDRTGKKDTSFGKDVPAVLEAEQETGGDYRVDALKELYDFELFMVQAGLSEEVAKLRQTTQDLKYDIETSNLGITKDIFLEKGGITKVYERAQKSLQRIYNQLKGNYNDFQYFLEAYRFISGRMLPYLREYFFEGGDYTKIFENLSKESKSLSIDALVFFNDFSEEILNLAFFASLSEYDLNGIAEGQGKITSQDVAAIVITKVSNRLNQSERYKKTIEWAKANNIAIIEEVIPTKNAPYDEQTFQENDYARFISLNKLNKRLIQEVKNGNEDVLFSKSNEFDTTEVDMEMYMEAKEISEKYPELQNINKLKPMESIVDSVLDKYGYENYLNIYNYTGENLEIFGQRYTNLTDEQRRATGEAIKMFYKNFIMEHFQGMESIYSFSKSNKKYKQLMALALDTFLQIEFNDNLRAIRLDLKGMLPFSRDVLYQTVNRIFRYNANKLLLQDISMMDTFEGVLRKDAINIIAGIYQSYRNVTQGKRVSTFETKFGGVQYTPLKQMDDVSNEYLEFLYTKVMNNEKGLIFEPESQTVSSVGDNFNTQTMEELLVRENLDRIQKLHNSITFSSKRNREMSLYELGYDYAIYSTDKYDNGVVFGFKSSDFHVGPNAIAKNIQFNFDGVAPYFTYDVLDFSQDGTMVRYRTSVRVAPAIVTKSGRAIENPVYFESGVGLHQIEMLLDGMPLVNQSATISSIADTNNYIYSYEKPTNDFGFGSTVRFTIQVDPKAMNNGGVYDKDGKVVTTKTISQRVDFFSPSKYDLKKLLEMQNRTEKINELTQQELLDYLAKGTAINVSKLVVAKNSLSQSNPFQEVDEFITYLDMDSLISLASLLTAGGISPYAISSTVSDVKSTLKRTRGAKEAAALNDLLEDFYEVASTITSDKELIEKYAIPRDMFSTKALLVTGFAQALNDVYNMNKANNMMVVFNARANVSKRQNITQEIIKKYQFNLKRISRLIDFLPYNYNNFNETVFTKLPKEFVPTIVMKVYGPTDSFSKVLESDKFKELEKKAKQNNINIKIINLTQFTQDMGSEISSQVESLVEELNEEGIDVNVADIGTIKQLQQEFLRNDIARMIKDSEVKVKEQVLGDMIADDSPVMFSKADKIKKSNKAKARLKLSELNVETLKVNVPQSFQKTVEEIEVAKKTRTKVSKVNFDTEYGRLDKGVPLYALLTKVTKQLRALIETQRFFGREYQEEGSVISRAIQELNKVKKEIESILGLKEPVKPFDANLDADQVNVAGISIEKLTSYRDEVFAMTLDKKSTANITSQIEQELFRVIDGYKKEAVGVLEAQSESQVIARPTEAILDTKIFEQLKDTPQFKLLMSLVKTYNYLQNKVASSFFIEQKQQLKNYASEVKIRIQNIIASLFDKAGMPGFNPFELTNTQQYKDAPLTFSKEVDDTIQKAMYDMTSDEAQKSYKYYNEQVEIFKQALDNVANDAQNQVLNGIETYTAANQEIATKVDEVIEPTGERLTRRAKKGEVQYVYRMLLGQRLKHAEKMKNSAKTDDGLAFWSRVYESTAIAYQRAMRGEVKIPKEDLQIPQVHKTIQSLRKEFIASKDVPDMKKFIEDNAKSFVVTEEVSVVRAREKQEAYQEARLQEKQLNTERKKKAKPGDAWRDYTGPSYVSLNDIKYSVGLQTNIGRVDFNKLKALSKGKEVTVIDEKVAKTYSPNTKKAYALQVEQAKVVEAKRELLVKAQQVKEKPGYNNKPKAFKEKTEKAIVNAKQEYKEAKDKLLYFKTTAELMMSKEKTPPLKTTVGQKVYYKPGVEVVIKETGEKKAFFKIEDAQKWLNSKIHNKTLQERGETVAVIRDANEILQPHDDVQEVAIINRMELDQDDVEARPVEVKPIQPQQVKVAKKNQWKPTEDLIIEYNGVEYTYTLADMQKMIANGNFNFETKQDFIDYQVNVIEATVELERKAQVAEQQQAETRATLQQATGSLNAPIAAPNKKVNIFKEIQANVLALDPNHYRNQEKAFGDTINVRIAELRSRKKLSKGEKILLGLFEQLQQTVNGYSSNDRVYNHVSMAVGKVLVLWLDKFYRGTNAKGKIRIPSKSELKDLEIQIIQAVFGALNYVDSELRVEVNKTAGNPNGYLYTKAVYWYLRDLLKVTKWDAQTTEAFAKDGNGDGFRRLINAVRNFSAKGYGISELIGAFNELDGDTAVPPITDMALREEEGARTLPTAARQWIQNSTENQDIAQEAGFDLRTSIGTDFLDPYTVSEIVSLFQEDGWGLALQRRLIEGQDRMFAVDDAFDTIFDEKWVDKNRKKLIELEKNAVNVSNLGDAKIPMSQIIYLRGMLMREIMRNRLIELGIIKGEKTFHFQNGGVIDVLAIRDNKAEAKDKAKQYKIVDAQALLLELTDIINKDAFAKHYTDKIYQMINKMYPMVNERFKEIHGAHLVNDGDTLRRELPNLSQTEREKLERLLPKGMTLDMLPDVLYMPFLLSSGNYFNPNKVSFKDVLNAGVFDGLTENLKDTNGIVSVESVTNMLNTYRQEVRNYYGLHRIMRDLSLLLNFPIQVGNNTSTLQTLLPEWAIEYYRQLLIDMAGYGVVQSPSLVKKWLPFIRQNFYVTALGFNVKVIATQFATVLNLWHIYGQGNPVFLAKMLANMAKRATPQNKARLEEMANKVLVYKDRKKGATFEIGEATKEGIRGKGLIETLKEFSMKGIQLTDNMINEAFYLTLLETINPKTGNIYTEQEAREVLKLGIIRSQSSRQALAKAPLLRSKNELVRILVKFMGEPMKHITQLASSAAQVSQIAKVEKSRGKIEQRAQGKVDAAKLKLQEEKEKLQKIQATENNPAFASEPASVQEKIVEDRKLQERIVQEEERKVREAEQAQQRINSTVSKIVGQRREALRLFKGRISAASSVVTFLAALATAFEVFKTGFGEDDDERDPNDAFFTYLLKKFGSKFLDEIIGMMPFVRDAYATVIKGYDYGTIGEMRGVNTMMLAMNGIFRAMVEGETVNWNRLIYNFALGLSELTGFPLRNIEQLIKTPLQYISEPAYYQYNNWIGGKDTDNQQLVEAIRENDTAMISVIIDNKIAKRNIIVHKDIKDEIKRLAGAGFSVSMVGIPNDFVQDGATVKLNNEQKKEFAEVYNQADYVIRRLFTSGQYRRLSDKYKARLIQAVYDYYYKYAKQDVLGIDTLSEELTFVSLNQAYTYFIGRAEAYRNMQLKDRERNVPTIIA